jgi:hypothetical protein
LEFLNEPREPMVAGRAGFPVAGKENDFRFHV